MILGKRDKARVAKLEHQGQYVKYLEEGKNRALKELEAAEKALQSAGFMRFAAGGVVVDGEVSTTWVKQEPKLAVVNEEPNVSHFAEAIRSDFAARRDGRSEALAAVILALELDDYLDPHAPTSSHPSGAPLVDEFWADIQTTITARAEERALDAQDAAVRRIEALTRRVDEPRPADSAESWPDAHVVIFSSADLENAMDEGVKP